MQQDVSEIRRFNTLVIRQKGKSQNGCFKKTKHAKHAKSITQKFSKTMSVLRKF